MCLARLGQAEWFNLRIIAHMSIGFRLLWVLVEQACITDATSDWWHIGSIDVLLSQAFPRHLREPRMLHYILAASVQVSKTLRQVVRDQLAQEILRIWMDVRRVLDSAAKNVLVDLERTAGIPEWCKTAKHLEDQDTKRPPDLFVNICSVR